MTISITDVRLAHPVWFAEGNKEFFGDISYRILHNKHQQPYLVRKTYAWTNMFGEKRIAHWRINPIGANLEILQMDDRVFDTLAEVKKALAEREATA